MPEVCNHWAAVNCLLCLLYTLRPLIFMLCRPFSVTCDIARACLVTTLTHIWTSMILKHMKSVYHCTMIYEYFI